VPYRPTGRNVLDPPKALSAIFSMLVVAFIFRVIASDMFIKPGFAIFAVSLILVQIIGLVVLVKHNVVVRTVKPALVTTSIKHDLVLCTVKPTLFTTSIKQGRFDCT
jgi:hypothetical protein